ncbi:glycosyltransferase [Nitrogeniibacter mangrovi]|nr:glycosyltransferase [Nitrogeniibacter mangrovi]
MALYTDDDVMRMDGNRVEPRFKPDFNLDLLRGTDYIGPLWTRTEAWQRAGGFSAQAGTRFYDLTLRVLDTVGAAAIGHIADPLLSLPVSPTLLIADKEAAEAVSTHLTRCGQAHRIRPGNLHGSWHVTYEHDARPAVDIVVPYRNWLEFTEPLVDSLFRLTEWPQFRLILVDAGSDDADCAAWRDRLIDTHGEQIRYVRSDAAWNWSELFNLGAAHSDAPYLLFLHHDTQILSGHWLERLMAHAMRPEVAAVAPRQAIPGDNSLDMTGTVFGLAPGLASPEAAGTAMDYPGYLGRLQLTQNFSLLASACLLVPRTRFDAVGGFDPQFGRRDAVADLTARLARDGLLVWTPTVTVAHYETDLPPIEAADELDCVEMTAHTQTALIRERVGFVRRYQDGLSRDPAWNLNLRLKADDIQPETTFVPPWHAVPADVPRVVADVVRGAGEYRAAAPLRAARRAGKAMGAIIQPPALNARRMLNAIELARLDGVTSFLIHNPALKEQIPVLQQMHTHLPNLPVIGLMDDLSTAVPHQSDLFDQWSRETRTYMRRCLALCDRLVVSTEPLAEFARHMIDDIRIVPNRLEWARWGHVQSRRRAGRRPRVGWAGAFQHAGDLALVEEAIRLTSQEVDWIFFGMCPASLAPYVREHHTWVDFDHYPEGLASLNLDLAIAPLEENIFNDAKSNLRLLDYGILGWPVVCSDVTPYRGAPVTRVANTTEAWVKAIREHVHDLDAAEQAGDRLREWVLADYILEEHVDEWLAHHLP